MTVAVFGATGVIGRALVPVLAEREEVVVAISRQPEGSSARECGRSRPLRGVGGLGQPERLKLARRRLRHQRAGTKVAPVARVLRDHLEEHLLLHVGRTHGLVFGRGAETPFDTSAVQDRADDRWSKADPKLERVTLHEARHTAASLWIAAGVNAKTLTDLLGHASIMVTFDRCGRLLPGAEDEARALFDAYHERASRGPLVGQ